MLEYALAALERQVQPVEFGIVLLQHIHHPQGLQVVLESAEIRHAFVQSVLAGMSEGRVSEIMGEADGLG